MLSIENLTLRRDSQLLFESASCQVHLGQHVGVTGANGAGKSSLFALINGALTADTGDITFPKSWVITNVAQETPDDSRAAVEYVLDGDAQWREIDEAMATAQSDRLMTLQSQYEQIDGYTARSRAAQLLNGLGFP